MRVRLVWVLLLSLASHEAVDANDNPTASTSRASTRDQDAVIQKIRGLRNEGMKLNDAHNFRGAIEKLRDAIAALHDRVFGEARQTITDASEISQDAALYAQILNDYGSVLIRAKQYDEAIEVLEDSIAMVQKIYGDSHPSLSLSLRSLAEAYMAKKEYKMAIKRYKTLRKHVKRGLGATHEAYIEASLKIAEGYKKLHKNEKTLEVLENAVKAQGSEPNGLTTGVAELYMELSTAYVAMNDIEKALRAAGTANVIFLQRDGKDSLSYAFSLNALAGVKMRQKEVDEAIQLLEQAHRIAVSIYGEKDAITIASAKTLREVKEHKMDLQTSKDEL